MPIRKAEAVWEGALPHGKGVMKLGSGAYEGPYSFQSRMENGNGTNPEELIGAALAGCFSMALSHMLASAGHPPTKLESKAQVHFEQVGDGWSLTRIDLTTEGTVPGLDEAHFQMIALDAKKNCPVSKALAGVEIVLEASLAASAAPVVGS